MATKEELEEKLREAKKIIEEMQNKLETLLTPPRQLGTVVDKSPEPGTVAMLLGGQVAIAKAPKGYIARAGDQAMVSSVTKGIEKIITLPLPGKTAIFKRYIDNRFCEIIPTASSTDSVVVYYDAAATYEEGDHVLMDQSTLIILRNLGKPPLAGHKVSPEFQVTWDDVGGLDDIREFFAEVFEAPLLHPEIYNHYNMKPPKGVLMTGPPGCGKSLIAKAVATTINSRATTTEGGFISVKGPEILSPWVGMAEQKIRDLFSAAREFYRTTGFPAVIFIDEAEAVMNKRGSGRSSDVDRTIVPTFLTEMDGLEVSGAIVIVATNRPELLDSAITRDGRIDRKIQIPRPNKQSGRHIFNIHLRHLPMAKDVTVSVATEIAVDFLYSDERIMYDIHRKNGLSPKNFCLRDLVSGAMIESICRQAAQRAMSRDIKNGKSSGITEMDLCACIESVLTQNLVLDHKEQIADFVSGWRNEVDRIFKHGGKGEAVDQAPAATPA